MSQDGELGRSDPSRSAVLCGRAVIGLVGVSAFLVPLLFAFADPENRPYLAAALMGLGLILVWLCIVLPPRVAAHFGFWLPALLPED